MDWTGIIGGLGGSIVSGLFGQSSAKEAANRQFEHQLALMDKQHQYQVDDFRHRYQWSVNDMRSAGLNPILAATQGIGGNINGVSSGAASLAMAPSPDFASSFNSAYQTATGKEIAKLSNDVARGELRLHEMDINSANKKRENDIRLDNLHYDLDKWQAEQANSRADMMNDAKIKQMFEELRITAEHYERMDANDSVKAAAAMRSADASGLMAAIAHEKGLSDIQMNEAREAYLGLQSANEAEQLEWQEYLNDHKEIRGAVGLIGSFFDTAGMFLKARYLGRSIAN